MEIFYFSFIRSILEYGDVLFAGTCEKDLSKINKIEIDAMRVVTGATSRSSIALLKMEKYFPKKEKTCFDFIILDYER